MEEVQAMSGALSPSTGRRYPRTLLCAALRVPRSSVYAAPAPTRPAALGGKRGPKTVHADAALVTAIRAILAASPFHGEGYRKVRARLAHRGLAVSGKRVLRLMRQHGLLAPRRLGPPNGDPAHAGTIVTDRPDVMWGTDATRFSTEREGLVLVLRGDRPLHRRAARLARCQARRPLGGTGADPPGRPPRVRRLRERPRPGAAPPVRLGPPVHRRCVDQRSPLARDHDLAVVRGRARVQRGDRAVQPHAEGAVRVSPSLREPGAGAGDHCGVHRALQSGVAHRAARPPHTRPGPGRRDPEGRMIADRSQTASHIGLRCHDLGATPIAVSPENRARDSAHECPGNRVRYSLWQKTAMRF